MNFFNFFGNSKMEAKEEPKRYETLEQLFKNASDSLERHVVSLKKEQGIDFTNHKVRVFVVFDRSDSMKNVYANGLMQRVLTRIFPIAVRYDDNKEMEVLVFNYETNCIHAMTLKNYTKYVKKHIIDKGFGPCGGTAYVPAIDKVIEMYDDDSNYPALGIFLTDGAAYEEVHQLDKAFKHAEKTGKIFWATIGLRTEYTRKRDFDYLRNLKNIVNNTNFTEVDDFDGMTDDQLFERLLDGYPKWLRTNHYI